MRLLLLFYLARTFCSPSPLPNLRINRFSPFGLKLNTGSIVVEDQDVIDTVTLNTELTEPGWITIHFSMSGAPAEVVGTSSYLEVGTYEDLVIALDDEMQPGWRYIALLHVDDGDQQFDIQKDLPVSVNGEVVRPSFVAIPEAATAEVSE